METTNPLTYGQKVWNTSTETVPHVALSTAGGALAGHFVLSCAFTGGSYGLIAALIAKTIEPMITQIFNQEDSGKVSVWAGRILHVLIAVAGSAALHMAAGVALNPVTLLALGGAVTVAHIVDKFIQPYLLAKPVKNTDTTETA